MDRSSPRSAARLLRAGLVVLAVLAGPPAVAQLRIPAEPSADRSPCERTLGAVNAGLAERRPDALLAAAEFLDEGRCMSRDEARAAQYLKEAARAGHRGATLRLARKFGRGSGVPQSYANAGAWVSGKGLSDEAIESWDYAVGYAYTVLGEVLAGVDYPSRSPGPPAELSFVVELDALKPERIVYRRTSPAAAYSAALDTALERALARRLAEVLKWLPAPDRRLLVAARVTIPVSLRYDAANELSAFEGDPLLR